MARTTLHPLRSESNEHTEGTDLVDLQCYLKTAGFLENPLHRYKLSDDTGMESLCLCFEDDQIDR
jgi:hypothetical protein